MVLADAYAVDPWRYFEWGLGIGICLTLAGVAVVLWLVVYGAEDPPRG